MQRTIASRLLRRTHDFRSVRPLPITSTACKKTLPSQFIERQHKNVTAQTLCMGITQIRPFSNTPRACKGISPDSDNPQPKGGIETPPSGAAPLNLSLEQYNQLSDDYMDAILEKLEELGEQRDDVDVEYSAGVLNLTIPPNGTYVINKQPPNKQIWLSSPISGPKRYDYVVLGEGQDSKEGTGAGDWVYLRDNTTLGDLLLKEVGIDLGDTYSPVPPHVDE